MIITFITVINDITENRIEKNLKVVSRSMLVELPADQSFSLEAFVINNSNNSVALLCLFSSNVLFHSTL